MSDSTLKPNNHRSFDITAHQDLNTGSSATAESSKQLPMRSGVSLKPEHYSTIIDQKPDVGWFEVHPENYMNIGGPPHKYLTRICDNYSLSMHGVGLSLGSSSGLDKQHLANLKQLVDRYEPAQVSEHLSWSHWNQQYFNDLLPLQFTKESFTLVRDNIQCVQDFLQRKILIENPSTYIEFSTQDISETDYLNSLCKETGCGLLLDVNNVSVCSFNHSEKPVEGSQEHLTSAKNYLENIDYTNVGEVHLAGHALTDLIDDKSIRIDDHGSAVCDEVWDLFDYALLQAQKPIPTLIEWDTNLPSFDILYSEASKADNRLARYLDLQAIENRK